MMALQQAAKTVRAHSRVQTEHNGDKLSASKGIIATLMKLCFLLQVFDCDESICSCFPFLL